MRIGISMLMTTLAACKVTSVNADADSAPKAVSRAAAPDASATPAEVSADAGRPPTLVWPPVPCTAPSDAAAASNVPSSSGPGLVLRPKGGKPIPLPHGYASLTNDGVVLRWNDEESAARPEHPCPSTSTSTTRAR